MSEMGWGFARVQRAANIRALLLVAPLLIFLMCVFIGPVALFLSRSFIDLDVSRALPLTVEALRGWNAGKPVPDVAFEALAEDLHSASAAEFGAAATRLNYALPGMRILLLSTKSRLRAQSSEARAAITKISPKWASTEVWSAIKSAAGPVTAFYALASLDARIGFDGNLERAPIEQRVFLAAVIRTILIATAVTALTLLFGFPFSYLMATSSSRVAGLLMMAVLVPFWTAIMVRVLSWLVLLGREGVVNDVLVKSGVIDKPLDLLYGHLGVYVALTQIFSPYMVLPLYGAMKNVPETHWRASASLGATPLRTFGRVYLPQISSGISAGSLLVFIQCLGVFVVPAILGGARDQNLPILIEFYVSKTLNWGLAAALSIMLLISVYALYWLFVCLTKTTRLGAV